MRKILILLLHVTILLGGSYSFDEIKYIKAVDAKFKKSGKINTDENKIVISYKDKQIVKKNDEIKIITSDKKVTTLEGKAKHFTGMMIDTMIKLGEYKKLMSEDGFKKEVDKDLIYVSFSGDLTNLVTSAVVKVKDNKVSEFEMFMPNEDRLKIIKK